MTDITIKIEAPELATAINALAAALTGGVTAAAAVQAPAKDADPEKPKRAPRAAKTSDPEPTSPTPEAETTAPTEAAAETASEPESGGSAPDGLVYDQVRDKVLELVKVRGRDAAAKLLSQFADASGEPCGKGTDLVEGDWPEFISKADALIEGERA